MRATWFDQGLEKGLEKGREEGRREALREQIEERFGPLTKRVVRHRRRVQDPPRPQVVCGLPGRVTRGVNARCRRVMPGMQRVLVTTR
jgi:hypothetical protein